MSVLGENVVAKSTSLFFDAASAGAIVMAIVGWLPYLAAFIGALWYCIQIWESHTVQHWWQNRKMVHKAKLIARLKAKQKVISAELDALEVVRQAKAEARDKLEVARVEAAKQSLTDEIEIVQQP